MRVRTLRRQLEQIPGALIDIPPGEGRSGDEEGVVGSTVHSPDASTSLSDSTILDFGSLPDGETQDDDDAFDPVFEWSAAAEDAIRQLGSAADKMIRKSVEVDSGSDALGHYLSFHVRGAQWGATVKASGVAWLVRNHFSALPGNLLDHARLAFHAILQHELFHFATDVAVTQGELAQRQAWFAPAKAARIARGEPYSQREEKLANGWMLKAFKTALPAYRVNGKQAALKKCVWHQPPGYRDALSLKTDSWPRELHDLVYEYAKDAGCHDRNPLLWDASYDWPCQFSIWPRINWRNCAIHFVDDSARFGIPPGWLTFLTCLSTIEESPKFEKQLAEVPAPVRERWMHAKMGAMAHLSNGHQFKPWPKGGKDVWSMRVDLANRAHLLRDRTANRWIALEIGGHKAMGHG